MTRTVADLVVELIRELKLARDERDAYRELLRLTLAQAGAHERMTGRQRETIARLQEDRRRSLSPVESDKPNGMAA